MVAAAPCSIVSPMIQLHLGSDVEKVVGVVRFSNVSSGCGDFWIVKELHRWLLIPLRLREGGHVIIFITLATPLPWRYVSYVIFFY
jgi:hypothetical protein